MTIAIDTGKKFKKPKIELSVAVIGSAISFVASVDVEKMFREQAEIYFSSLLGHHSFSTFFDLNHVVQHLLS